MTEERDQDHPVSETDAAEPIVDPNANPVAGEPAGEIDADGDGVIDDADPHPISNDPNAVSVDASEASPEDGEHVAGAVPCERADRRNRDMPKTPAPKPKADAGLKPQRSATKAGKGPKKSTYNPGKTPPKPIELKDHSPWYIPWIGTSLIVLSLIILVVNYVLRGLPPFYNNWIWICFIGMTADLIVLSKWK